MAASTERSAHPERVRGRHAATTRPLPACSHRAGRIVATGNADRLYEREPRFKVYDDPGLKEMQFRYLPAFAVLMTPLGALPVKAAEAIWAVWNACAWLLTIPRKACRRHSDLYLSCECRPSDSRDG